MRTIGGPHLASMGERSLRPLRKADVTLGSAGRGAINPQWVLPGDYRLMEIEKVGTLVILDGSSGGRLIVQRCNLASRSSSAANSTVSAYAAASGGVVSGP